MARKRSAKAKPAPYPDEIGPTDAQLARGHYVTALIPAPDGRPNLARVHINRGGTPIMRWAKAGSLSDSQMRAIDYCTRLWRLTGLTQRVTGSYGERMPASSSDLEERAVSTIEAREDLYRVIDYFPGPLRLYWGVFENVCRHDMPAGIVGAELGHGERTGDVRAHQIVCFVADFIAMKERL